MLKRIDQLPTVLTSFGYRPEYVAELGGMLATVTEHHRDWPVIIGRGPLPDFERPTLEVDTPSGTERWTLPVPLNLDGSVNDFVRICMVKAWWTSEVWHRFGDLAASDRRRLLWLDADARLNGSLDFEIDPEAELIAGPWEYDHRTSEFDHIAGGLILFQGTPGGVVETMIDQWSTICLARIQNLPPPNVPWLDSDQEALTEVLRDFEQANRAYVLLKLDYDKYCGEANPDGTPKAGALVDQWMMSEKMKWPKMRDKQWPPPEELRRGARAVPAHMTLSKDRDGSQ